MKDDSKTLKLDYSSTIYQLYYKKQTTNSIEPTDFKSKKIMIGNSFTIE